MSPLLTLLGEVTAVFAAALLGVVLASKARAAVRHLILASAFGVTLILPLAMLVSPTIAVEIAILPAPVPEPVAADPVVLPTAVAVEAVPFAVEAVPVGQTVPSFAPVPSIPVMTWLLIAWAGVALIAFVPVVTGLWHLRTIRRGSRPWREGTQWLDRLASQTVTRRPAVLLNEGIAAPITGGLLRPAIALPADAINWDDAHITNALLHELEHVRRCDWAVQLAARAACALYWFHPLAWIAWRSLRLEAERACDDAVLARGDAAMYAEQLLELARRLSGRPVLPGLQMAGDSSLSSRIKAVLDDGRPRGRAGRWVLVCVVIAGAIVVAVLAPLRATGPTRDTATPATAVPATTAVDPASQPQQPGEGPVPPIALTTPEENGETEPASPAPVIDKPVKEARPISVAAPEAKPVSPQSVVASILDLVDSAMTDESTGSLDDLTYPITGLRHVQRYAQAALDERGGPAAVAASYTEIINALINTANQASNIASRPPRTDLSSPTFQKLSAALRAKSVELATAVMPTSATRSTAASTPQQLSALSVLDLMQTTRRDTTFFDPVRGAWLATELGTLERAAQSFVSDDVATPGSATLKLDALRSSIQSTARQASQIAGRANAAADVRRKAAGLAASLRDIDVRLEPATVMPVQAPDGASWKVSLRSVGPLPIGASISDVRSIIADPSAYLIQALRRNRPLPGGPDDSSCAYLTSARVPAQVGLMFQGGRLVRVDVWKPGIPTTDGVQVGDSESQLLDTYGSRINVKDRYAPAGAHYMSFTSAEEADREYRMRFETDGNAVTQYRTGLRTAVEQVDGCD